MLSGVICKRPNYLMTALIAISIAVCISPPPPNPPLFPIYLLKKKERKENV
jgi:hypothetical protein